MGIGTIVGSAIFNALGVAAIGSLAAIVVIYLSYLKKIYFIAFNFLLMCYTLFQPIKIESRAVTRDVIIYMFNVGVLVVMVWDGQIDWYEALILGILYILYFVLMFNSVRLFGVFDRCLERISSKNRGASKYSIDGIMNMKVLVEYNTLI